MCVRACHTYGNYGGNWKRGSKWYPDKISGGFGYLEDSQGKTIRSIEDVERGEYIKIIVSDGSISATVADKEKM